jgi:RNA-binding protein
MNLSSSEKKSLKAKAHHLDPVVFIGQEGLTPAVLKSFDEAITARELIKVKFVAEKEKEAKETLVSEIAKKTKSSFVSMTGHIAVFYREKSE